MQKLFFSFICICTISFYSYSQNIKSPGDFLGYEFGTEFTRNYEIINYFKHLEENASNHVILNKYGETNERRPLYLAIISSEENIKNIETIRTNNLKQTGILDGNEKNDVAIIWLSYNVHGNEASCSEAAMQTAYELLNNNKELLNNTVVIIDPSVNPDGRDRYVNWFNQKVNKPYNIDPQADEHNEPWPSGRPNHYLFDLNRDWAWATQIESQQRIKMYNSWMPHIHVDFHEQGINEPYYFAPAAEPFHEIITDWQKSFQTEIGKNNAKYFDEKGWLFFTRESFDLFYPSYGDTYPTFMGAIGMTYEQAGHGTAGVGILNDEGHILTLKERLTHHTKSGISTIEMASKNASKLNKEFSKFFKNESLSYKSYILKGDSDKIEKVKSLLNIHQIKYNYAANGKVEGYVYSSGKNEKNISIDNNDLVILSNQPKGKMVKVLFEPKAKLSDSLTYDITAWSIPYAHGLEAIASKSYVKTSNTSKNKSIPELKKSYGYVSHWKSIKDAKFLSELLNTNIRVRYTEKPLLIKGEKFNPGALIITNRDNTHIKNLTTVLNSICKKHNKILTSINSGYSDKTPDIGSPDVKLINKQNIAIVSGEGTSSLSYGEVWHFFEKELKYPITSINTNFLKRANLNEYNIIILPNGYYGNINNSVLEKINDWVKKGGKLIAIDNALRLFSDKEGFNLERKKQKTEKKPNLIPYNKQERNYTNQLITGAIIKTKIDNSHPMAFGYEKNYFTLKLGSSSYKLLKNGYNIGYIEQPKVFSGFAGKNALNKLINTLIFGEEQNGRGSYIYFVDNVLFRSFWENGKLFFANSIFFKN